MKSYRYPALFAAVLMLAAIFSSCLEEIPAELDETIGDIPAPSDLSAVAGDGTAEVTWSYDQNYSYSAFRIYRSDDNQITWHRVGEVSSPPFNNHALRNGVVYWYKISGVAADGLEGGFSFALPVSAGIFSITANNGDSFSAVPTIHLSFSGPALIQSMIVSEDSLFLDAAWTAYAAALDFSVSGGDGVKIIYARFKDELGNVSRIISDSIVLDSHAAIGGLVMSPAGPFSPGGTVHFSVTSSGFEVGGKVEITILGLNDIITALDNGLDGDTQGGDGIYEVDYFLPSGFRTMSAAVSAEFTDAAGNTSGFIEFAEKITITDPPPQVYLYPASDSTTASIGLRWSQSDDPNFAFYDVYRDVIANVTESGSARIARINNHSILTWNDAGLDEAQKYYYRVYVINDLNESAGSIVRGFNTEDLPPAAVVCDALSSIGVNSVTVTWSFNMDSDFKEYRVFRSMSPGVTDVNGVQMGGPISDRYQAFYDDFDPLLDTVSNVYYYRVYVYDKTGHKARSNEVATQ